LKIQEVINSQNDKNVTIRFVDDYYDMTLLPFSIPMTVNTNVIFLGNENGTVFDYKNNFRGVFDFTFIKYANLCTIKIQNIIFENFSTNFVEYTGVQTFYIKSYIHDFQLIYTNCTFRNNKYSLFHMDIFYESKNYEKFPQIVMENCNF